MKKFLLLVVKIGTVLLLALAPVNILFHHTNFYRNNNYEIEKFKNVPSDIELANFGSSHAQLGFYYSDRIPETSFNFALSSQTPQYDLAIFKTYLSHFKKGATILLPISYFSLYTYSADLDAEFKVRNRRYYSFLSYQNIINYDIATALELKFAIALGKDILNFRYILKDVEAYPEFSRPYGDFPLPEWLLNAYRFEDINQVGIDRWTYWSTEKADLDPSHDAINPDMRNAYLEIVRLAQENGLKPVFVTLPVTKQLNNALPKGFLKMFYQDIRRLTDETGVPYLNYSHDTRFIYDLIYFIDTDHLNKVGAEFFTDILIKDLRKKAILGSE